MTSQKEISIRTLETPTEQERYENCYVFRQDGDREILPYFAVSYPGEGILFVSKILGQLSLTPRGVRYRPIKRAVGTVRPTGIYRTPGRNYA